MFYNIEKKITVTLLVGKILSLARNINILVESLIYSPHFSIITSQNWSVLEHWGSVSLNLQLS